MNVKANDRPKSPLTRTRLHSRLVMQQAVRRIQLIAVTRTLMTLPRRSKTNPRRPQRFLQASAEFLNERISSPGCIAPSNSEARGPN